METLITSTGWGLSYEPLQGTGVTVLRCPALGWRVIGIVDDFGDFHEWNPLAVTWAIWGSAGEPH